MSDRYTATQELAYLAREIPPETDGVQPLDIEELFFRGTLCIRRIDEQYEIDDDGIRPAGEDYVPCRDPIRLVSSEYVRLASACQQKIHRDRYPYQFEHAAAALDVFKGPLTGLVSVVFSFDTPEDRLAFLPPDYCGEDVTGQEFLTSRMLAGRSYQSIARRLGRLGYLRLEKVDDPGDTAFA